MMKIGDSYRNFVVVSSEEIAEIKSVLLEIEHKTTGSKIIIIVHDDDENVFNLSFQTTPSRSDGVAHILEHMVLCGSKNYPVKSPFFSMTRRSLNTFMNAFTGSDFTCYPAASQISEDFYNLLSVYIDAVFYPLLTKRSFLQEGWRLEFLNNDVTKLYFNGVVFNEMKGSLITGEARLGEALGASVFPDITYGVNSGGDPKDIVLLDHAGLKLFHETFYHPSRCLFYFYGNMKPESHLDFLEEKILRGVDKVDKLPAIPNQKRFKEPVRKKLNYPARADEGEDKVLFGVTWLTCSILDQIELLALNVLEILLMGTDVSPLKYDLLKSGLCKQAYSSMDNEIKEVPFTIICKGCSSESAQKIEETIRASLEKILKEGFPKKLIEGAVHQLELIRKEVSGYSYPYGLVLFSRAGLLKLHGGNPADGLKIHSLFSKLRENLEKENYLKDIMKKYLLDNSHYAAIIMEPDFSLEAEEKEKEEKELKQRLLKMSQEDIQKILIENKELKQQQEAEDDCSILPRITIEKVPSIGREFSLIKEEFAQGTLFLHDCFTNDLIFIDIVSDIPLLSSEEFAWLKLMSFLIPNMGCGGRNYKENLEYLLQHTGGVDIVIDLCSQANNPEELKPALSVRGKALRSKTPFLFAILGDIIKGADFSDYERLKELLVQHCEALTSSLKHNPMSYAVNTASASLSSSSSFSYLFSGLPYVKLICELVRDFDKNKDEMVANLLALQQKCLGKFPVDIVISSDKDFFDELKEKSFYGFLNVFTKEQSSKTLTTCSLVKNVANQGRFISSSVAFNVLAFPLSTLSFDHPDRAALSIASHIMDNTLLHPQIREKYGAYGSGAVNNISRNVFYFYSYRDPEIFKSQQTFFEAIDKIVSGDFDDENIKEGILGVIQDLDIPVSPGSRGSVAYLRLRKKNLSTVRQNFRKAILSMTKDEVIQAVTKYLLNEKENAIFVSFSGEDLLLRDFELFNKPLSCTSVYN